MLSAAGTSPAARGCEELRDIFETLRDVNKRLDQATLNVYGILYISHILYKGHIKRPPWTWIGTKRNPSRYRHQAFFQTTWRRRPRWREN